MANLQIIGKNKAISNDKTPAYYEGISVHQKQDARKAKLRFPYDLDL